MDTEYNLLLVGLSFAIAVFGSFTALRLAVRIPTASSVALLGWVSAAAVALGGGAIWSMHFIGMIAFETSMQISYDPFLTIASLLLPVIVVGLGLLIVGRGQTSVTKLLMSGFVAGIGVCVMHYTGMAAMIMPAEIQYDKAIVALSIVIAIVAATAAFWLAFNLRGNLQWFGSAVIMGIAVCGMHYTAMEAVTLVPKFSSGYKAELLEIVPESLGFYVFGTAAAVLIMFLLITIFQTNKSDEEDELLFK